MIHFSNYRANIEQASVFLLCFSINLLVTVKTTEMASIPVYNPQIPFLGLIPGTFRPSMMIRVRGNIRDAHSRWEKKLRISMSSY